MTAIRSTEDSDARREQSPTIPPLVSIAIAAYNCEATIGAAVESCLKQTYPRLEVIVVNDGSTDGTAQALRIFGSKIKVIHQANAGLPAARNTGMRASTGEYVAWMDGDDLANPGRIRCQAEVLASHPAIELVSSDFSAFVTEDADIESSHIANYYTAVGRLGGLTSIYTNSYVIEGEKSFTVRLGQAYEALISGNFVHPPTVMVRKNIFDRVGFFDETLKYNSDYDLILRIARIGSFAIVDAPLLRYRRSSTQMSHAAAGGRIPIETARILEKVQIEDPDVYARHQSLFRLRMAESFVDAAHSIGPSDRFKAFGLLMRAVRLMPIFGEALYAFARIIVPSFVVFGVKRFWRLATGTAGLILLHELGSRAEMLISLLPESPV